MKRVNILSFKGVFMSSDDPDKPDNGNNGGN